MDGRGKPGKSLTRLARMGRMREMLDRPEGEEMEPREVSQLFDYHTGARRGREEGTVVAVHGDVAEVLLRRGRLCEGCGSCCVAVGDGVMLAEAENRAGAGKGDRVVVDLPAGLSIRAAFILYGVPLLGFLLGLGVGALLDAAFFGGGAGVPLALIFGFGFLALTFFLISRVYAPGSRAAARYRPVVTEVLEHGRDPS